MKSDHRWCIVWTRPGDRRVLGPYSPGVADIVRARLAAVAAGTFDITPLLSTSDVRAILGGAT